MPSRRAPARDNPIYLVIGLVLLVAIIAAMLRGLGLIP